MTMLRSFLIAVQFLTSVPVRLPEVPGPADQARALLCYPLVGLAMGLALAAAGLGLGAVLPPLAAAALLLALWVLATGALHLDGVADTADGWLGGGGDRARTLRIMRDPHTGAAGTVALVVLLLAKFAALVGLLVADAWAVLIAAPLLGRAAMPALLVTTPYLNARGLGAVMARHAPRREALAVAVGAALLAGLMMGLALGPAAALVAVALPALAALAWRQGLMRWLGGTSGDTAGALLELVEVAVLLAASAMLA